MPQKPNKNPNAFQKRRYGYLIALGCILGLKGLHTCAGRLTIHHIHTGGADPKRKARKDHDATICLCHLGHQGAEGIDRREYGASEDVFDWESKFGTEDYLLEETNKLLKECS